MENWGLGPIKFEGTWYIYLDVYMDGVYFLSKKDWLFTVIGRERIRYYLRVSHKGYSCREWRNEIKLPVLTDKNKLYNFCDLGVIFIFKITCLKFFKA